MKNIEHTIIHFDEIHLRKIYKSKRFKKYNFLIEVNEHVQADKVVSLLVKRLNMIDPYL